MKKILIIILSALSFFELKAQDAKVTSIINFTGLIDKYPIEMKLETNQKSDSVAGEYYYKKNGNTEKIILEGKLINGELNLQESTYNIAKRKYETTGKFRLNYIDQIYLSGSWQKPGKDAAYLTVKLTARENLKAFNPSNYVFQYARNRAKIDNLPADAQYYFNLVLLKVFVNKSQRWIFTDFHDVFMKEAEVLLEDVNFDGYLDIKIPIYYPGVAKGDYSFLYFIYQPEKRGFIQSKQLNDLGVIFFDAVKKEAQTIDADGRGNEGTQYYRWQNGKLFLVKEERVYDNDSYTHFTYYKIENGKSVLVKTEKKK